MTDRQGYTCPVCGYPDLSEPPRSRDGGGSYEICWSCGFEFGVTDDDLGYTYDDWRRQWVERGMPWDSARLRPAPPGWDPAAQLAGLTAVTEPVEQSIRAFTLQLADRLPVDVVDDVLDRADRREWLLALEVFADQTYASGVSLTADEWSRLRELVTRCGGDVERVRFLEPREP